ncbi:MAG: aminopeptidase, partial [Candidatus Thiodiazotropha sp. 6PLUC5]
MPPSGPFDNYSFQLANRLVGNDEEAAGLEITMQGPTLRFSCDRQIALTGADIEAEVDGQSIEMWSVVTLLAGQTLKIGRIKNQGARSYLA